MDEQPLSRRVWPTALHYALIPALAVGLVTAVLLALAYGLMAQELERRATLRLQHRAITLAQRIDAELDNARAAMQLLARQAGAAPAAAAPLAREDLEFLAAQDDRFVWIGLIAPDGRVLTATKGWLEGRSVASRPVFDRARERSFVGDAHAAVALAPLIESDAPGARVLLDIGEPVRDAQGRLRGVLAAHLDVRWIERLRDETLGEAQGKPLPASRLHVMTEPTMLSVLPGEALPDGLPSRPERAGDLRAADGVHWLGTAVALGTADRPGALPWHILALQRRDAALGPVREAVATLAVLGGLAALVVAALGMLATRRLIRPWLPILEAAHRPADGAADPRAVTDAVADAVVDMVRAETARGRMPSEVEAVLGRLAEGTRDLRRIVDHLPVGVCLLDATFRTQYVNQTLTRLLGWTTEQAHGRLPAEFMNDPASRAEFVRMLELLGDPPGEVVGRVEALRADGERVAVQWYLIPIVDEGRLAGSVLVLTDIRAERAARARAEAMVGRMLALTEAAVDEAFATLDAEGRVLEWSAGAAHLSGHPAAAAIGQPIDLLLLPTDAGAERTLDRWLTAARRDRAHRIAARLQRADGQCRWFEGSLYALGLAPGRARFGLILHDTTRVHEVMTRLEASEARLWAALDAADMGTWELDLESVPPRVNWSPGYERILRVARENLPTEEASMLDLVPAEDLQQFSTDLLATVIDDAVLATEFRIRTAEGERWHAIRGRTLRHPDGRAQRLVGVGMDVTQRRTAEQALQAQQQRLAQIIDAMGEGLVVIDANGVYTLANPAAAHIVGTDDPDHIVGQRYDDAPWSCTTLAGRDLEPAEHAWARLRRGEGPIVDERLAVVRPDGSRCVVSLHARPVHDAGGNFTGALITFADITERADAERARLDSEASLAAIVDGASDAIISTTVDGRVTRFNPAAARIFGLRPQDILGQKLDALLPPAQRSDHQRHVAAFERSGITQRAMGPGRVQGVHADGRTLELEASISQCFVGGQAILTAILRDVTARVAHEREIEKARSELATLAARLIEQEKDTSRRLAQALHDELGQTLTALRPAKPDA